MMIMLFIVFIVFILFALLSLSSLHETDSIERGLFGSGVLFSICVLMAILCGNELWGEKSIKPIDVYRGNTRLEITYKDNVAIDSIVVWK